MVFGRLYKFVTVVTLSPQGAITSFGDFEPLLSTVNSCSHCRELATLVGAGKRNFGLKFCQM